MTGGRGDAFLFTVWCCLIFFFLTYTHLDFNKKMSNWGIFIQIDVTSWDVFHKTGSLPPDFRLQKTDIHSGLFKLGKMQVFSLKKYPLLQQKLGFPFKQDHMITRLYFTFRRNLHTPHLHPVIHLAFPFTSACCVNKVDLLAQSRHSRWQSVLTLAFVRFIL